MSPGPLQQLTALARQKGVRQIERDGVAAGGLGDLGAFADAHGQALTRFAYLLTGGRDAADDLVQTVLLRLLARGIGDLADPLAYARRSLVNEHRDQIRRDAHRAAHRATPSDLVRDPPAAEDRLAVLAALEVLTVRERAAVVLRYYEDLADQDIAGMLGCSRATVRSLIHRATPKLRRALDDTYPHRAAPTSLSHDRRDLDE